MKSIFDLPQSVGELPALNQGMSRLTYEQVPPLKNIQGTSFPGGRIEHRWEVSGNRWWIPSRSYIRLRASLTNGDGSVINLQQTVAAGRPFDSARGGDKAPNMGVMGNLFQSMEFKIAQKVVSRISDRVAQIDALYNRLNYSKSQLDSWGASTNCWQPSFEERQQKIALGGSVVDNVPEAVIKPSANQASTVAITAAAGAVTGINTTFTTSLRIGDKIRIGQTAANGGDYTVTAITGDLAAVVYPWPTANIAATALWTRVRQKQSPQRSNLEFIWKPPLGIFSCPYALPAGRYELSMIPQNSAEYMKKAIESLALDVAQRSQLDDGGTAAEIQFNVQDLNLYIATTEGPRVDDLTYMLDIEDINCQVENITGNGFQQKNFDVEPSSTALTIAWQAQNAGLNTLQSQSKFKFPSDSANYPSDNGSTALTRFFVRYGLDQKPSPDFDPIYASPTSYLTELYAESQLYSGQKFNEGSPESQQDWLDRGPYLYFAWPRDATDESTRVNINYQFNAAVTVENVARTLLFNHYKNVAMITVKDGRVTDVVLQQG